MTEEATKTRRRHGGRAGNARLARGSTDRADAVVAAGGAGTRRFEPLGPGGVGRESHDGAMRILEEIGVAFLNEEALALFRAAGARVRGRDRVARPRGLRDGDGWESARRFLVPHITPWNPGPPDHRRRGAYQLRRRGLAATNYWDLETGARCPAPREHCRNLLKLFADLSICPALLTAATTVEPVDVHPLGAPPRVWSSNMADAHRQGGPLPYALGPSGSRT